MGADYFACSWLTTSSNIQFSHHHTVLTKVIFGARGFNRILIEHYPGKWTYWLRLLYLMETKVKLWTSRYGTSMWHVSADILIYFSVTDCGHCPLGSRQKISNTGSPTLITAPQKLEAVHCHLYVSHSHSAENESYKISNVCKYVMHKLSIVFPC